MRSLASIALCFSLFGMPLASEAANEVCPQNADEAGVRLIAHHIDLYHGLIESKALHWKAAQRGRIDDPNTFFADVERYLAAAPGSALLIYGMDDHFLCALLFRQGRRSTYARREMPVGGLKSLIQELGGIAAKSFDPRDANARNRMAQLPTMIDALMQLGPGAPAERAALSLYAASSIKADKERLEEIAGKLSSLLFLEELHEPLAGISALAVVPVGPIPSAPFALLRPVGTGERVMDLFPLSFLAFAGSVKELLRRWNGTFQEALIFGNPKGGDDFWKLAEIPASADEATEVGRIVGGERTKVRLGPDATVREFYRNAEAAELLYFASHGIANEADALRGSYLALADGMLTADMVKNMELNKARLVVMSACQSGLGAVTEGGVIGLARTFLDAGAHSSVMTLWNVSDTATQFLMQKFATNLAKYPPAEALRLAQRETWKNYQYQGAAYWAGFSIYGGLAASGPQ